MGLIWLLLSWNFYGWFYWKLSFLFSLPKIPNLFFFLSLFFPTKYILLFSKSFLIPMEAYPKKTKSSSLLQYGSLFTQGWRSATHPLTCSYIFFFHLCWMFCYLPVWISTSLLSSRRTSCAVFKWSWNLTKK